MGDNIYTKKRTISALLIMTLLMASILSFGSISHAEDKDAKADESLTDAAGTKDEVVYANLSPTGDPEDIYVVNVLNIGESGTMIDYGEYDKVSNLTDTKEIINSDGKITVKSDPGIFYYEGYGVDSAMPWIIDVSYYLGGSRIEAEDLAGTSGALEIDISTSENPGANPDYYDNYMLQISVPLSMDLCTNIDAGGGATALSGNTTLVNFTVLPGNDSNFSVKADVSDFEMDSISISGIPFSMDFDLDELTSGFDELANAASQLDSGMSGLNSGIQQLSGGLDKAVDGSDAINKSLAYIASILSTSSGTGNISDLIDGLEKISKELGSVSEGMTTMISQLDNAAAMVPAYPAEAIGRIQQDTTLSAIPDVQTVVNYASNAAVLIGAYNSVKGQLGGIATGLGTMSDKVDQMASGLEPLKDLPALQSALSQISKEYSKFNKGIIQSADGGRQLAAGGNELAGGMSRFDSSVQNIPGQINDMMSSYLGDDDYTPVSFVSDKNTHVNSVQFVMTTDKIAKPKTVKMESDSNQGKESVWQKITGLFK